MDTNELASRLRVNMHAYGICAEAADALEAQAARIAELEAEAFHLRSAHIAAEADLGKVRARAEAAEAEVALARAEPFQKYVDANEARIDAEAKVARLREALDRQADNMSFVLNRVVLPEQWQQKFVRELAEDRDALRDTKP